jgi:dipeptidyl aminopeptidase/acylaminoacyl peptidase
MRNVRDYVRTVICVVALFVVAAASAAEPPPLSAYGNLPDIETVALSSDGSRLAAVMSIKGERVVVLLTDKLKTIRMMRLEDAKVRSLDWVGSDALVVEMSRTEVLGPEYTSSKFEFWHAVVIPADPAKVQTLVFDKDPAMLNAIFGSAGTRNIAGHWTVYFAGVERERGARGYTLVSGSPALFAVDPLTNHRDKVADRGSQGQGTEWLLGSDGKVAATYSIDILRGSWQINAPGGKELADGIAVRGDAGLVALGKDGKSIIYRELDEKEGRTKWKEVSLDGQSGISQFAYEDEISRLYSDRATGELIGYLRAGESEKPHFYDPKKQAVVDQIYKAFPALNVRMVDWTPDFSRVLVRTDGNQDSGTWYLIDMASMHAVAIGFERVAIGPEWVGKISRVAYKAQDGLALDGILTLPPGREPKDLPLVMLPHGGPHAYDEDVFDWWAQAFASRGYAVFQPNFRGSTNRDETFMRAGFGQWGKAMQTDISDGLAELARRGIVDPRRACIMGASYGGYAALAGVTMQHGLYRCAIAIAGVADVGDLFANEKYKKGAAGFLRRSLLEEFGSKSGFDDISPPGPTRRSC